MMNLAMGVLPFHPSTCALDHTELRFRVVAYWQAIPYAELGIAET